MKKSLLLFATIIFPGAHDTLAFIADLFCSNDASFRFSKDGTIRDCKWIIAQNDTVTKTLCQHMAIRSNCPHSCGICCEDNIFYRVKTLGGEFKTCSWIGQQDETTKLQYCNMEQNGTPLGEVCAATCNICEPFVPMTQEPSNTPSVAPSNVPSIAPSVAPSRKRTQIPSIHVSQAQETLTGAPFNACTDNPNFVFLNENGVEKNCSWIKRNPSIEQARKNEYCPNQDISHNCQDSCDLCMSHENENITTTATATASPQTSMVTTPSPQTPLVTTAPTFYPSVVVNNNNAKQTSVPSLEPTITSSIAQTFPSEHPTDTKTGSNNNNNNNKEGSIQSKSSNPEQQGDGTETTLVKETNNRSSSPGSTATWILSFVGVFLLVAAVVRVVGKKTKGNVVKTYVTKANSGASEADRSPWIVTFLSGSFFSDVSDDDENE